MGGKISFWCYRKFNDPVLLLAKDPSSDLIRSKIIPAISNLRQVYPLKLTIFFPTAFLDSFLVNQETDLTNITTTDMI